MSRPDEPDAYARLFATMPTEHVRAFLAGELVISGIECIDMETGDGIETIREPRSARLVPPAAPIEPE